MWLSGLCFCLIGLFVLTVDGYFGNYYCEDGRDVMVHMFEWKHTEVARECEEYLADAGFCSVQVFFLYFLAMAN